MKFGDLFRPKSPQELEKQVKKADQVLGGVHPADVFALDEVSIVDVKDEYKTRYDAYLSTLRAERQGKLDSQEIKRAKEWITALNNLDHYIKDHESKDNPLLREKQFLVFKKIRDFLEQGKRKGYVKLPTGTGKTILFLKIAEALNMRTFVVSPSLVILDQNAEETEEFTESEFGKYYGSQKDLSKKVTHITYHSLINALRDGLINPNEVPILILDEAHEALGPERVQAINQFNDLQIGFTATSEFSKDKKVKNLLEEEIFRMDVTEAIHEGLICQTQTIHAYTDVDMSSVGIKKGEYDQEQLEKVVNVHGRNMAAIELYKNKFSSLKAFCNCSGVQHAQDVAKLFNENGIKAACITGDTLKDERIQILKDYKEGTIKVLTNARVLLRGFNEPSCSVTLNLHPTLSLVDAEQRARSGRLDKNNPDKWNYVIDFIDQNAPRPQVLYSKILGFAKVWNISEDDEDKKKSGIILPNLPREMTEPMPPINLAGFSMDQLKIVVDTHTIMEITNAKFEKGWTFESVREDVLLKNIKSSKEYSKKAPEYRWPSATVLTSKSEFPKKEDGSNDWDTFFDREKFSLEKLRNEIMSKGIQSSPEYNLKRKENGWPTADYITSLSNFPKNLDGSNDWDLFLGKEKFSFEKLRGEVTQKNIKSSKEYNEKAAENKWPAVTTLTSRSEFPKNSDGSNDWGTFLGREKFSFEKLRNDVISKGITTSSEYYRKSKENGWPKEQAVVSLREFPKNSDGSNDWDTFLGREKFSFEKLRNDVISKGIKSSSEYHLKRKENGWPTAGYITSLSNFPKKEDKTNDWDAFLGRK